jgi:iron complex transport system substrate-binding protein
MRMTCLSTAVLLIAPIVLAATTSTASFPDTSRGFPVSIDNCGTSTTYADPPRRAFTMNQAATEIMLALGLHDRMVGTAFLDDSILPQFADAYKTIEVRSTGYPSRDVLFGARPDFVYAAYPSAFSDQAAGMRDLLRGGTRSFLSPSGCREHASSTLTPIEMVFAEIRDIGRIFGVLPRAEQLVATYRSELALVRSQLGAVDAPLRVLWWDSAMPPFVAACCGTPNEILRLAGGANIFDDVRGSWGTVSWADVVARNPQVIVFADATWAPAADKLKWLLANSALAEVDAVKHGRFVTMNFSDATPGIRNVAAVRKIAETLYPERFRPSEEQRPVSSK